MEPSAILAVLLDLAREAGLEVKAVGRAGLEPGESLPGSGVVRVKGAVWVMLSSSDPVAVQLAVLAGAVREHAAEHVARRHVPPAVRELLDGPPGDPGPSGSSVAPGGRPVGSGG